ncbi:hypothetical protein [Rhizobium jaguaris]|uniref:hypothetical protein n=1 Tax=Rhizobium jaguaris TaxID=1312183 RepID=UPI0013C43724|nr:hypothetical protein [Rhizobium jaguaris]
MPTEVSRLREIVSEFRLERSDDVSSQPDQMAHHAADGRRQPSLAMSVDMVSSREAEVTDLSASPGLQFEPHQLQNKSYSVRIKDCVRKLQFSSLDLNAQSHEATLTEGRHGHYL